MLSSCGRQGDMSLSFFQSTGGRVLNRAQQIDPVDGIGKRLIPLVKEVPSDLDSPLSVYLKLAGGPNTYLFESVEGGEHVGRYSIIGLAATWSYAFYGKTCLIQNAGKTVSQRSVADPLAEVARLQHRYQVPKIDGLEGFTGGLVGWFGFECIHYIEPTLAFRSRPDALTNPDIFLLLSQELAVFDNVKRRLFLIVHYDPGHSEGLAIAQNRLTWLTDQLHRSLAYPHCAQRQRIDMADFQYSMTAEQFRQTVLRIKEYIRAGDVFQVVPSHRLQVRYQGSAVDVYRALRMLNPSPYMYLIDSGTTQIVGSSPEILARLRQSTITVRPIAGTRPRGKTPEQDQALEAELLADKKERAEHLMLVDLGRNDVGRLAQPGTVQLMQEFVVERYSHVMHIVSTITGRLRPDLNYMDVLRATFPAGTVSGAPKLRALEIISELEPVRRNIYSGAVGYLGWQGDCDTAIAIRTAIIHAGSLYIQAGAGVVYDSDPDIEWQETINKGQALVCAVQQAAQGLI